MSTSNRSRSAVADLFEISGPVWLAKCSPVTFACDLCRKGQDYVRLHWQGRMQARLSDIGLDVYRAKITKRGQWFFGASPEEAAELAVRDWRENGSEGSS